MASAGPYTFQMMECPSSVYSTEHQFLMHLLGTTQKYFHTSNFSVKVSASRKWITCDQTCFSFFSWHEKRMPNCRLGGGKNSLWEFNWKVKTSGKIFSTFEGRGLEDEQCRLSHARKGCYNSWAVRFKKWSTFFQFIAWMDKTKNMTWQSNYLPQEAQLSWLEVVQVWHLFIFLQVNEPTVGSFINKTLLELQGGQREINCNQDRIKRKARTKWGSRIINVRVSLSEAQMNRNTDFSMRENLIQGCAIRKLTRSSEVPNYEIQGSQHKAYMKKLSFSGLPKAKVSRLRQLGALMERSCVDRYLFHCYDSMC